MLVACGRPSGLKSLLQSWRSPMRCAVLVPPINALMKNNIQCTGESCVFVAGRDVLSPACGRARRIQKKWTVSSLERLRRELSARSENLR
eukprot:COSAG02_NODE_1494_length_12322_cov_15.943467_2_plen_90_part_00